MEITLSRANCYGHQYLHGHCLCEIPSIFDTHFHAKSDLIPARQGTLYMLFAAFPIVRLPHFSLSSLRLLAYLPVIA
jgi:hypothetical protein